MTDTPPEIHFSGEVTAHTIIINNAHFYGTQPAQPDQHRPTRVFISYARADDDPDYDDPAKSFLRRLFNALTAEFIVWWDRVSLPARSLSFTKEIEDAIRACDRFVLVVGPGAIASEYVKKEWTFALDQCKPVTPILRAGDFDLIPPAVAQVNAIDCRPSRDETAALTDLIARLREDAPLGDPIGVKPLPRGHITREAPYNAARDALCADAIQPTVISAPPSAIALYGLGGIGKSTLAAALSGDCQIRRHFRDGILWIEVGQTPAIPALQASIGAHFGDSRDNYQTEQDATFSLSRLLRDKAALLVLDDVWDYKLVERFPVGGTACRLLITTRSGALANHVSGADIRLDLLTPEEGARLLAGIAGGDETDPLYRQITEKLGGHTLAVSLAARQIVLHYADSAADMLRLIEKRASEPEPFRDLVLEATDKDQNLALSLSLSYDALPDDDDLRRRFRQTGIFPLESSFDRAALAAVWGDADKDDARRPLQILEGAGLLDAAPEPGYYTQHRLLRAHARALLDKHGETEAAFNRYADFVIEAAAQFKELPLEEWGQLDPLLPHVHEVGDRLVALTPKSPLPQERGLETPPATQSPLLLGDASQGAGDEGIIESKNYHAMASRAMVHIARELRQRQTPAETILWEALRDRHLGNWKFRRQHPIANTAYIVDFCCFEAQLVVELDGAIHQQQQTDDADRQAVIEAAGWHIIRFPNDAVYDDLEGVLVKLLETLTALTPKSPLPQERELETPPAAQSPLLLGEQEQGASALTPKSPLPQERGLETPPATQSPLLLGEKGAGDEGLTRAAAFAYAITQYVFNRPQAVETARGRVLRGLDWLEMGLAASRQHGDQKREALFLNQIALAWSALGEKRKALDFYQQALPLSRAVGDRGGEATTLTNIGGAWDALGEKRKALDFYQQALPLRRAVGDRGGEATTLNNIGLAWDALGEKRKALDFYQQALPLFRAVGDRGGEATTLNNIGGAWSALGEKRKALDFYQQALPLRRAVGDRGGEATTLNNIGLAWSALGEKRKALDFYQQALPLRRAVGDRGGEAVTLFNMSFLVEDNAQAIEMVQLAYDLWSAIDSPYAEQHAAPRLAKLKGRAPSQEEQFAETMRQLAALYAQGGADAIRQMLQGQVEDAVIEQIITLLAQNDGE